jgi:hypothetical protein
MPRHAKFVRRLRRPVLRMRKPWQFAALGCVFWVAVMLADLDFSLASGFASLRGMANDDLHTDDAVIEVCKSRKAQIGLVLIQYWAYAVVFALSSINGACALSDAFKRSWDMDMAHLNCFKCALMHGLRSPWLIMCHALVGLVSAVLRSYRAGTSCASHRSLVSALSKSRCRAQV